MQFWRRKQEVTEVQRADVILARKPEREPDGARRTPGLLQVVIPRHETRRTHQRGEDRRVMSGVTAQLFDGGDGEEVAVANVSSNGVMIDTTRQFAIGNETLVAIDHCDPVPMIVRWVRGTRVGLEFLAETTIIAQAGLQDLIIDTIRREVGGNSLRTGGRVAGAEARDAGARHSLMWLCELAGPDGLVPMRLRNISRAGCMATFDRDSKVPAKGQVVELAMGEDACFAAQVAWVSEDLIELQFDEPFPLEELTERP